MDMYAAMARSMAMNGRVWARHANPWSVYTRFAVLPGFALAVWSREWIGGWAWAAVAAVVAFVWLNPRLFGPATPTGWSGRGVLGERVWLRRHSVAVPQDHRRWANGLSAAAGVGLVPFALGLWQRDAGLVLFGLTLSMGAKTWFVDRMGFLWQQMRDQHPDLAAWATGGPSPD